MVAQLPLARHWACTCTPVAEKKSHGNLGSQLLVKQSHLKIFDNFVTLHSPFRHTCFPFRHTAGASKNHTGATSGQKMLRTKGDMWQPYAAAVAAKLPPARRRRVHSTLQVVKQTKKKRVRCLVQKKNLGAPQVRR